MDSVHLDRLARAFQHGRSRRGALAALLGGSLGLFVLTDGAGKKRKRKRTKRKNRRPVAVTPLAPGAPAPTCADGVKNGGESDVDCGGTCPRCANTLACVSQDDCASALCVSGVCQACFDDPDCGIDADGACQCRTHDGPTQQHRVCTSRLPGNTYDSCDHCPESMYCVRTGLGDYTCFKPCGAV